MRSVGRSHHGGGGGGGGRTVRCGGILYIFHIYWFLNENIIKELAENSNCFYDTRVGGRALLWSSSIAPFISLSPPSSLQAIHVTLVICSIYAKILLKISSSKISRISFLCRTFPFRSNFLLHHIFKRRDTKYSLVLILSTYSTTH